jgi:glycosyltransferase involved in cell wall biosynthesis
MKGYTILASAAKKILDKYGHITFFAIGTGDEKIKEACTKILGKFNNNGFFWLGHQDQIENFYSGFDVALSSSLGEGFSNSIAEAMSCGVPCVVTDVGDSALIVGATGVMVRPNNPDDLVRRITEILQQDYKALGEKSRQRIIERFSINTMVNSTENEIIQCVE